jgi:hypothetical protein
LYKENALDLLKSIGKGNTNLFLCYVRVVVYFGASLEINLPDPGFGKKIILDPDS